MAANEFAPHWNAISEIRFTFSRHSAQQYSGVHVHLNQALSEAIPISEFDTLFLTDTDKELGPDPFTVIRNQIALTVINILGETPLEIDNIKINDLFRHTVLRIREDINSERYSSLRTKTQLNNAARSTATAGLRRLEISLGIDNWTFNMRQWSVYDFTHVGILGITPPQEEPQLPAVNDEATNANDTTVSESIADSVRALVQAMHAQQQMFTQQNAQPQQQEQQLNPPAGRTAPHVQTDNVVLPREVSEREKLPTDPTKIPSMRNLGNYLVTHQDANGHDITVEQRYYLHPPGLGPRYTTRTGQTMYFLQEQDRKTTWRKEFMAQFPRLSGGSDLQIREWYRAVTRYGFSNDVYIHPYFLFRTNATSQRGFSVGDDTQSDLFDIPRRYESMLHTWSSLIFDCLSKDKTIPDSCPDLQQQVKRSPGGLGYEALYQLIATSHPINKPHPSDLVKKYPEQDDGESFQSYFYKFVDFLHLRAFISNRETEIDEKAEVSTLILNCKYCNEMRRKTDEERDSPIIEKRKKYKAAALLTTLSIYYAEIEANKLRKPKQKPRPQDEITYRSRTSHRNRQGKPSYRSKHGARSSDSRTTTPSTITPNTAAAINILDEVGPIPDPPDDSEETQRIHSLYTHSIYKLDRDQQPKFDISKPCAVCYQTGHTFEGCPLLNNVEYLKQHRIQTAQCLRGYEKTQQKFFPNNSSKIFRVHTHHGGSDTSYHASSGESDSDTDFY